MEREFNNLHISKHPIVLDGLSRMRQKDLSDGEFKSLVYHVGRLIGYEVTQDLALVSEKIETPVAEMDAPVLSNDVPVIFPILRAALGTSAHISADLFLR